MTKSTPAEELRQRLRDLIARMGSDPTRLSKQIGRSKDYLRDFLEGRKESISPYTLAAIERVAELESGDLTEQLPVDPGDILEPNIKSRRRATPYIESPRNTIRVYPTRESFKDNTLFIEHSPLEEIDRPSYMQDPASYGLLVEGLSGSPAYEAGDIIFLSPSLGLRRGCDIVAFIKEDDDRGPWDRAMVARLVDYEPNHWKIKTFNPPEDAILEREVWPKLVRIVAKIHRR